MGLLGSAYKRKAEYLFRMAGRRQGGQADDQRKQSRKALEKALGWYRQGNDSLLSHHWTGTQYLSLTAVLKGTLVEERDRWTVTRFAADKEYQRAQAGNKANMVWPLGTLAELYLLQPLTVPPDQFEAERPKAMKDAERYLRDLAESDFAFAKESTARQFERYMSWWADAFPNEGSKRLKEMALKLRELLPKLEDCAS